MENICTLSYDKAIEAIKDTSYCMYKHGVWNPYDLRNTENVIKAIKSSGYGADVRYDKEKDLYYVSIPCSSDMW